MANLISTTGPICPNVTDTPLDNRSRVSTIAGIGNIPLAWRGMLVYCEENGKIYKVTSLKPKRSGPVEIENYYPATWVEFGSGGSTPSPTPSAIDAGDVTYSSGGTFIDGTVGKELQSLASDILGLAEDIHNLSGDIGTLRNLDTVYQQDLVGAINEVLASTGSTIAVVNNLLSDSTTDALSAYQGKVLKGLVDGKVAGIKVQGESSILPMDGNGIVTIPASGGGGTGTITGATVGGNPVTASGGILQFDAYPTANTMQYSSFTNYDSGTIGKEVKDLNGSVNNLSTKVAELDKPSPTPSSSTTVVNLANYTTSGSSFTYDVDNKYIYNTKDTTFYQYSEEDNNTTVYYGVFKVIGEDRYLMYSITNNTTFTYTNTYTESTLPENAKKEFALGSVAVVKRVNGEGESWQNGTVNLFCTKQNMPLRNRCRNINFNGSTAWRVLIKSEDGNTIFVYKAKANGNYEWEINVPRSSTVNFNLLDKYFDRPEASNVSFDDSVTQLSIQGSPVNNVQTAIQLLATKIYGFSSTLIITLTYSNGIRVANTVINISAVFQGNEYDFSSQLNDPNNAEYVTTVDNIKKFKTNSSGECRIGLPIGATYELTFNDIANYIKPEPITGITDSTQTIIGASYQAMSDYETVILKVVVHGVSGYVTPSGKKVYIDTYNQNNTSVVGVEGLYEITLNANGVPDTVKIKEGTSYTTVTDKVIKIDKGVLYKVRLDDWDNTGVYITSTSPLFNAQKVSRGVTLAYTYTLSGTYLLLKDLESEDGYKNYRIIEIDSTNNKIKIAREINGVTNNYWIYKNSNDVYIYEESQDVSTAYAWFEDINVDANNPIVGIGFRSQLLNNPSSSSRAISGTCAFCVIPYNVANVTAGSLRESGTSYVANNAIDGLANEESWLEVDSPTSVITKNIHNITASIGNNTYNAFLPAYRQLEVIIQNIDNINLIFSIFNKSLVIAMNNANNSNLWSSTLGNLVNYTATGIGANGYNKNMSIVGTSSSTFATNTYKSIPVFPY